MSCQLVYYLNVKQYKAVHIVIVICNKQLAAVGNQRTELRMF